MGNCGCSCLGSEMAGHCAACPARPSSCPWHNCSEMITQDSIYGHLATTGHGFCKLSGPSWASSGTEWEVGDHVTYAFIVSIFTVERTKEVLCLFFRFC